MWKCDVAIYHVLWLEEGGVKLVHLFTTAQPAPLSLFELVICGCKAICSRKLHCAEKHGYHVQPLLAIVLMAMTNDSIHTHVTVRAMEGKMMVFSLTLQGMNQQLVFMI